MHNYIFGTGPFACEVAKRLDEFDVPIKGFLKKPEYNKPIPQNIYKDIPTIVVDDKLNIDKNSNIYITKKPMIIESTIDFLRKNNYANVYIVSEEIFFSRQKSQAELFKYFDRVDFDKPFLNYLETNVVDQCNLNCKGCAHFSNICNSNFVSIEQFKNDLELIAEKFYLYNFRLLGGEPLLHPQISTLVEISRNMLPNSRIILVTNGLLINKLPEDTLQKFSDNNIIVSISLYQPTYENLNDILKRLNQYDIKYYINDDYFKEAEVIDKFETRLALEKQNKNNHASERCIGRFCHFLRDGKISKCYYPLLSEILNQKYNTKFEVSDSDYIDIREITDGWGTIEKLQDPIPFCDYCRENAVEFDWEGNKRNDSDVFSYVLKKK